MDAWKVTVEDRFVSMCRDFPQETRAVIFGVMREGREAFTAF